MKTSIKEAFLHYLWRFRRFELKGLKSTEGEDVELIHTGTLNHDGGPDFSNGLIRIGKTLWAGNVEMHVYSSIWMEHKHQDDRAYDNVILHVVYEEDLPVIRPSGERIPCIELKGRIPKGLYSNYKLLMKNSSVLPCASRIKFVPEMTKELWLERLLVERLEEKISSASIILKRSGNHFEEAFYQQLARHFGCRVNNEPFERLARDIPFTLLSKYRNNPLQLEALLFGQAGFLEVSFKDDYPRKLKNEFAFLRKKHQLQVMDVSLWKWLRLRPANFPTIRIAQFVKLIQKHKRLFSSFQHVKDCQDIDELLHVEVSDYWRTHYRFDVLSVSKVKALGKVTTRLLCINAIAPFIFLYGKELADDRFISKAMNLLSELPAERNAIIRKWKDFGVKAVNSGQSQALLHLGKNYCNKKRCLECAIGTSILKS